MKMICFSVLELAYDDDHDVGGWSGTGESFECWLSEHDCLTQAANLKQQYLNRNKEYEIVLGEPGLDCWVWCSV
jgi:hypothetical protein